MGGAGTGGASGAGAGVGGAAPTCSGMAGGGPGDRVKLNLAAVEPPDVNPPQKDETTWASLAFDARRSTVVAFGGQTFDGMPARTWRWDGSAFSELASAAASPTPRSGFAMTYDATRGRIVLFGGFSAAGGLLDDVWEWDGARWAQMPASTRPTPRKEHALAYDAVRGRTLLFGGTNVMGAQLDDTWEWDGTTWRDVTGTGTRPLARRHAGMAFDPVRGRTVLFGGDRQAASGAQTMERDTWEWDGQSWTRAYGSTDGGSTCNGARCNWPRGGAHVVMAFDPLLGGVVAYSGTIWEHIPYIGANTPDAYRASLEAQQFWLWKDQRWVPLVAEGQWPTAEAYQYFPADNIFPTESPTVHHWGLTFDECRQRLVLFRHNHRFSGARVNEIDARFSANTAPALRLVGDPPGRRQVFPGRPLSFSVAASDADQDALTFSTGALPTGAIAQPPSSGPAEMSFYWTPAMAQAGDYTVTFQVTDGLASASLDVPIQVGAITYAGVATGTVMATGQGDFMIPQFEKRWDLNGTTDIGEVSEGLAPCRATCTLAGTSPGELAVRCLLAWTPRDALGGPVPPLQIQDTAAVPLPETFGARSYVSTSGSSFGGSWAIGVAPNSDGSFTLTIGNIDLRYGRSMSWRTSASSTLRLAP